MADEPKASSANEWPETVTNLHAPDDSAGFSEVPKEVIEQGHEADLLGSGPILAVPIAVVIFFFVAFATTTALFFFWVGKTPELDKDANPWAVEKNAPPLNERIERTSTYSKVIDQPRLEAIVVREAGDQSLNRSSQPLPTGNSPEFHPEDLRNNGEYAKKLGLTSYHWANEKEKTVRIPIEKAMELVVAKDQKVLPALDKEKAADPKSDPKRPKASNSGGRQPLVAEKK